MLKSYREIWFEILSVTKHLETNRSESNLEFDFSQTMSTVTLNFRENVEFKNTRTYMEYLFLLKNNVNDLKNFFFSFSFKYIFDHHFL